MQFHCCFGAFCIYCSAVMCGPGSLSICCFRGSGYICYILLSILSKLYQRLDTRGKAYLLIVLLFVPTVLHDAEYMLNAFVDMPCFAIF